MTVIVFLCHPHNMNQMKNLFMKQLLSLLLCLSIIVPSMAKKEQRKQNVFPDGTPISEWFLQTKVVHPDSLGKKYDLSDYGIESNPHSSSFFVSSIFISIPFFSWNFLHSFLHSNAYIFIVEFNASNISFGASYAFGFQYSLTSFIYKSPSFSFMKATYAILFPLLFFVTP